MEEKRFAYAQKKLQQRLAALGETKQTILQKIEALQEQEELQKWMIYLYATLPLTDLVSYSFETWIPYVEHALYVRREMSWCQTLGEDIFADYVLYPRINTEDIEECRKLFYQELAPRVKGLSLEEAILEVNYWCQENATYQSADDRTASAMTVYRSGSGRCGEESTFTVTALRSVGIPARQVYAPWWSHCDDNHAWVEAYVNGKWHFLGACEPEPVLDKGWFTNASSRAMLIHTRTFTGAENEQDLNELYGAERAARCHVENGVTYEHITDNYAITKALRVHVQNAAGQPVKGALVRFEILNMAEFSSVANMTTNEQGFVDIRLGLGHIQVHVVAQDEMAEALVKIEEDAEITLALGEEKRKQEVWHSFDFTAPHDYPMHPAVLTEEQRLQRDERMEKGTQHRNERIAGFYRPEEAAKYDEDIQQILQLAKGNFDALAGFLAQGAFHDEKYRKALLKSLTQKDYRDVKKEVLDEHLICAMEFCEEYPEEIFIKYVLCPRVFNETLAQYRALIQDYFDEKTKKEFVRDPERIMSWMEAHLTMQPEMDYQDLFYTPAEALRAGKTDPISRKILFVAICRSLGIAARLNPVDGDAEYWKKDRFVKAKQAAAKKKKTQLVLTCDKPEEWAYRQIFTVGKLENGIYRRIDMPTADAQGVFRCEVEPGEYRLLTVNRLPNGHMYAYAYLFTAEEGAERSIELKKRHVDLAETLSNNEIVDFDLQPVKGQKVKASTLLRKQKNILVWIEEGKEPTEHILNEMMQQAEDFRNLDGDIIFMLRDEAAVQQATLARALKEIPGIRLVYDDFHENVNTLGRRMYVDPDKLPLVLVLNKGLCGVYASSGYNVGLADILVRIIKAL